MNTQLKEKKSFDYKWVIAALSFVMVFTVLGFCSSTKGLYIAPITEALSISRGAFSINDSCRYITTSVINLFFGFLIGRFGARKLIAAGFLSLIISCLLYSFAENVYLFYLGGVFLGMGIAWTTTTMVGAVIGRWFKENRGTIMGAILAANGVGAALAIQVVSPIINKEGTLFGYRDAYRLIVLILVCVGLVVVTFFRNNPKDYVDDGSVSSKKKPKGRAWEGLAFAEIIRKPYFYIALFCIFATGMILNGISGVSAPLYRDVGLPSGYIALILSIHSLCLTLFKFGIGIFYDKKGLRKTSNTCFITAIIVMLALTFVTNSRLGMILAMFYAIFSALALPLETVMLPIYSGDIFGEKAYDKVLGVVTSVNTLGFATGSPLANICFDLTGNYNVAIYFGAGLMVVATIFMQYVFSASKKDKAKVAAQNGL